MERNVMQRKFMVKILHPSAVANSLPEWNLLSGVGWSFCLLLCGVTNMRSDHGLHAVLNEDAQRHSRHTGRWSLHRMCFLRAMMIIGCFFLASQRAYSQQPWPSVREFILSGQDWQTVADFKLSNQELSEVQRITARWTERHCGKNSKGKQSPQNATTLSAKRIPLQVNGPKLFVVNESGDWEGNSESCSCAPHLNCRTWVLSFKEGKASILLEYNGMGIVPLKSSRHGYFDLVTASGTQTETIDLRIWRFDGKRYQSVRCASRNHAPDEIEGEAATDGTDKTAVVSEHPCH
jgi:hypothetical protein